MQERLLATAVPQAKHSWKLSSRVLLLATHERASFYKMKRFMFDELLNLGIAWMMDDERRTF